MQVYRVSQTYILIARSYNRSLYAQGASLVSKPMVLDHWHSDKRQLV